MRASESARGMMLGRRASIEEIAAPFAFLAWFQ